MSFLSPQDRTLLLESLRPPDDYQLDVAIGTTYSLDLIALMVAPVGFTLFEVDPHDPEFLGRDPLEVLEAIRRHASQIVLFYEAGRIAVPRNYRPLLTYLEDRIVPLKARVPNRSFHPKVWFLRYSNLSGDVGYRMICLSRNLTFDRCWDTVLVLDGQLRTDRKVGFSENAGLRAFIEALPEMAVAQVSSSVRRQISRVAQEIGRVDWDLDGLPYHDLAFWPLGHDGVKRWPFRERMSRVAVISPFLSDKTLRKLCDERGNHVLVSRQECLDKVAPTTLDTFAEVFQMADSIAGAEIEDPESLPSSEPPLRGLHAKLYVADDGRDAHTWTGSANATISAFDGNVEFMVQLTGKKNAVGVEALLQTVKGTTSFLDLLQAYEPPDGLEQDPALEALENEIEALRMPIAAAGWSIEVRSHEDGTQWVPVATTRVKMPLWAAHIAVTCRPASIAGPTQSLVPNETVSLSFNAVALESLTSFLVVEIEGRTKDAEHRVRFLVNAELVGAPANRRDQLLRHMLQDKQSVLRFLLLLLGDDREAGVPPAVGNSVGRSGSRSGAGESQALLEPLLRTLDRNPGRLDAIHSLLAELGNTEEGKALVPEGLEELFASVWEAKDVLAE